MIIIQICLAFNKPSPRGTPAVNSTHKIMTSGTAKIVHGTDRDPTHTPDCC